MLGGGPSPPNNYPATYLSSICNPVDSKSYWSIDKFSGLPPPPPLPLSSYSTVCIAIDGTTIHHARTQTLVGLVAALTHYITKTSVQVLPVGHIMRGCYYRQRKRLCRRSEIRDNNFYINQVLTSVM